MKTLPFITSFVETTRRICKRVQAGLNESASEKNIRDAILMTFYTGSVEYLEAAYNKSSVTTVEFYRVFQSTIADFKFSESPLRFIKKILNFFAKHGLDSRVLEDYYNKWVDYEWYFLINDIEDRFFWKWMFENGMKRFELSYILENSNVKFKDVIDKIASRNEYVDVIFNKNLNRFLNSVWEAVLITVELPIEEAISTIVHQFPNYEVRVLNHAYHYVINHFTEFINVGASEMLLYVIERMADYEYYAEKPVFSEGESRIPKNDDGHVNLNEEVEKIIDNCCRCKELSEIVWILENRFNIDSEYIKECMCRVFFELCSRWDLKTVVIGRKNVCSEYTAILPTMMQFADGYRIFLLFFEDLAKKAYCEELKALEDKYGMNVEMNVTF